MTKIEQKIPEGWQLLEFNQIAMLCKKKYTPTPEEHLKCLELEHFEKETGCLNGYTDSAEQSSTKNVFNAGDVLFGKLRPYLKKFNRPNFDGVCSTEIWVLNGLDTCKNSYLYLLIQTNKFNNICNVSTGTHMPRADWNFVENIPFFLPPLPEQEKIAGILGTWDEAIEKLSSLIEQKKNFKKGLMQRFLTGKTRLNGFTQPWKEVKLGKITEFKKGKQLNKLDMIDEGLYPVLNGGISYSGYTNNWNTEKNTITISEGGNSCGYVSYIQERFWSGGHCYTLDKIKVDKIYLYQLLKFEENNLMKLRVGSGLPNIQLSSLNKFKVNIPIDTNEQKAIADVLSTADEEIDLLNKKLEALKEQKKGLMQQLLTGQTRVKVN